MRPIGFFLGLIMTGLLVAQEPEKLGHRYGYDYNASLFSQKVPVDTVKSVVKALDTDKVDYLIAHLVDPTFVDQRIAEYQRGFPEAKDEGKKILAFNRLVKETKEHFVEDPGLLKELRLFARDGQWEELGNQAIGTWKGTNRKVFLRRIGERWFMEQKQYDEKK